MRGSEGAFSIVGWETSVVTALHHSRELNPAEPLTLLVQDARKGFTGGCTISLSCIKTRNV